MKFCSHRTFGEVICSFKQKPRPDSIHRRIQMWGAKCKSGADSRSPQQLLEDWQSPWDAPGQETATGQIPQTSAPRTGAGSANLFVAPTREPGKTYNTKGNHSKKNSLATVLQYKQKRSWNIFIGPYADISGPLLFEKILTFEYLPDVNVSSRDAEKAEYWRQALLCKI